MRPATLASVRLITDDVDRLAAFYERVTGATADRPSPEFAELRTERGTLAIGSTRTVQLFGPGAAGPSDNRTAIVEFLVDDVDALFAGLDDTVPTVTPPTTMPWGNRSLLVRDPDGTLVNLFTPVSAEARERAGVEQAGTE
ncbi:VOC family protein [Promicromonospora sp. MS192]|uniref:VOC family protein n=1 Tax=Promicromonospora sp. MS192 TaxID=3412684 RepID=UPI003C2CA7B0